ncbi:MULTISPECIES: hypothetical protein [unclassified Spiroplasma]|uniref:hypothetical protein n=1 Tax=unclassified Spiroplasma TaxID=2637901 RepID=UPI0030D07E16
MNKNLQEEYEWINRELKKIIINKNQFTPEIISNRVNLVQTTIVDINENLKKQKISKFKKISYSILKIFTFGKIDKNKIIKEKNDFFIKISKELFGNIKKVKELYIRKSNSEINIDVNKINNVTLNNLLINPTKSNLPQM